MGTDRTDAGVEPMLASPPAPQSLLSESANPMNRMNQAIHFWDYRGHTEGRVLGIDSACAVLSLTSFNWIETGEDTGSQGPSPTPTTLEWAGSRRGRREEH